MSKGLVLGVVGKARVGKDTFANYLIDIFSKKYGREFKTTAFAYRLKQMCLEHFNLNREQLWGDLKEVEDKRYPMYPKIQYTGGETFRCGTIMEPICCWTPREIMQNLGSFYRSIDPDFWVRKMDENWKLNNCPDLIITDVRMPNECWYIKEHGILIKIIREDAPEIHNMQHESETSLNDKSDDYFDITIENNGTLEDLQVAAFNAAKMVLELEQIKEKGKQYNG